MFSDHSRVQMIVLKIHLDSVMLTVQYVLRTLEVDMLYARCMSI